jgi:predicted methyltransferase
MMRFRLISTCALIAAFSCSTAVHAAGVPGNIAAAVADGARPADDKSADAQRKPAETLAFAGVTAGEQVAELIPGKGYWTRILSKAVGAKGHVYALAPERPANAPAERPDFVALAQKVADDPNYGNVSVVTWSKGGLAVPQPVDLLFTARNYHDLHNIPELDIASYNKQVLAALKPGGIYLVLDHSAEKGSGARDTKTLHRIDADLVKKEVMDAGFEFVGMSPVLANSADPRTGKVFDPDLRGKTDQFILKFRKPRK